MTFLVLIVGATVALVLGVRDVVVLVLCVVVLLVGTLVHAARES